MKKLLIVLCLAFAQFAIAQVRVNLNSSSAVTFPVQPVKSKTDSVTTVYSASLNGGFYLVTVKDMTKKPDLAANSDTLEHFYNDLLNSTIKKSNAKLVYRESATINDAKGIEFSYTVDSKSGFPDTRFQHSVYIGKTLFSFAFWTFKDKLQANTADRDRFFNSIGKPTDKAPDVKYSAQVKPGQKTKDTIRSKYSESTKATLSKVGYSTGYVLGAVILTALIIGLLVMIKKTYDNKKV